MVQLAIAFWCFILGIIGCIIIFTGLILFIILKAKTKKKKFIIIPIILFVIGSAFATPSILIINTIHQGNKADEKMYGPLVYNIKHKNTEKVRKLLETDTDVNMRYDGLTPLMIACSDEYRDLEIVTMLINNGAEISAVSDGKATALIYALSGIQYPDYNIIELLIEHGADVNEQVTSNRVTPLSIICSRSYTRDIGNAFQVTELLIDKGAKINTQDISGQTPLMKACGSENNAFGNFDFDVVKLLIDNGADVHIKSKEGYSALDYIQKQHENDKNYYDYKKWATQEYENNFKETVQLLKMAESK